MLKVEPNRDVLEKKLLSCSFIIRFFKKEAKKQEKQEKEKKRKVFATLFLLKYGEKKMFSSSLSLIFFSNSVRVPYMF